MSSNPWDFHDELVEEIGRNKKIDRYVHLPFSLVAMQFFIG